MTRTSDSLQPGELLQYFAPFLGIGAGSAIAWFAAYASGASSLAPPVWVGRFFSISTSLLMWSIFTTLLQNKEVYGGGMFTRTEPLRRTVVVCLGIFFFWAFALISYVAGFLLVFWLATFVQMALLFGEVGWKDPLYLYRF